MAFPGIESLRYQRYWDEHDGLENLFLRMDIQKLRAEGMSLRLEIERLRMLNEMADVKADENNSGSESIDGESLSCTHDPRS